MRLPLKVYVAFDKKVRCLGTGSCYCVSKPNIVSISMYRVLVHPLYRIPVW